MSTHGNLEWIAAKIGDIEKSMRSREDKRLSAFEGLLSSIESSLADVVDNVEKGGGAAAIKAMADALKTLTIAAPEVHVNVNPTPVPVTVNVPEQKAPSVNVNVSPTPVTFEAVMPAAAAPVIHLIKEDPKPAKWEIRLPGQYGAPDRVMTITRT